MSEFWGKIWHRIGTSDAFGLSIVLIMATIVWEIVVDAFDVPLFLLPAPSRILTEIYNSADWLYLQAYYTIIATLAGFGLAIVVGVILAVGIASSVVLEKLIYSLLVAFNSIPKVAIAPLFILWIGTGLWAKIIMAMVLAIFAIVIDVVLGLRSVDPDALDMARSLGGRPGLIFRRIRLPNALPSLFAGMKVAISLALIGTIVGEFVSSSRGLGFVIMAAQGTFNTTRIFAALVLLSIIGVVLFALINFVEKLCIPWHVSRRKEGAT